MPETTYTLILASCVSLAVLLALLTAVQLWRTWAGLRLGHLHVAALRDTMQLLATLTERIGNGGGTSQADLSEVRREISALAAQLNDVDERGEARFRRLTARRRRAEEEEPEEVEEPRPALIRRVSGGETQPTNGADPGRRRLIPRR